MSLRFAHIDTLATEATPLYLFDRQLQQRIPVYETSDRWKLDQTVAYKLQKRRGVFSAQALQPVYYSADRQRIIDRAQSHVHDDLTRILPWLCPLITCKNQKVLCFEFEFEVEIGYTTCVTIHPEDELCYAVRHGRRGHSQFVRDRAPEPTRKLALILRKKGRYYEIVTAFKGALAEPEPWDFQANARALNFWKKHALIWGSEPVVEGTLRTTCPW